MAGKDEGKTASKEAAAKAAADKKAADDAAAAKAAEDDKKATDDKDDAEEKPAKKEKTFTEAELKTLTEKAVKAALKKADDEKDLSDLERLQKENEELKAGNQLRDAKDTVIAALTKAGSKSPELLWKAMKGDLEFDDKGGLKNLDTLVASSKTDFADQFGEPKPDSTIEGGAGQQEKGAAGTLTKEKLAAMTPKEINELDWKDVKAVMEAK